MNNKSLAASTFKTTSPCRDQYEFTYGCLDDKISQDHKARKIWEFVENMDTDPCYMDIKSIIGDAGRAATDPKVLFALWLFAYSQGVTSGREIVRLINEHDAYRWIAGGTGVNRSNLSTFRSSNLLKFQELLTSSIAVMVKADLLKEEDFGQDGTRLQAAAGFSSFRTEGTLEELLKNAKEYVKEVDSLDPKQFCKVVLSARKRAAREKKERIALSLKELQEYRSTLVVNAKNSHRAKPSVEKLANVRASYTDPQARKMKMGDGGFRMAHNMQFVTGVSSLVIYGVGVSSTLDAGTMPSMMNQTNTRLEKLNLQQVRNVLADSAYSGAADINTMSRMFPEITVYAPAKVAKDVDPTIHRPSDTQAVKDWRDRLETEDHKEKYKHRSQTCEFPNMILKNNGLENLRVRGTTKVLMTGFLNAIMYNISRFWDMLGKENLGSSLV
jgi:transposase